MLEIAAILIREGEGWAGTPSPWRRASSRMIKDVIMREMG